ILLVFCFSVSLAQNPLSYWTFDKQDLFLDQSGNKRIDIATYKANVRKTESAVGSAIRPESSLDLLVGNLFGRSNVYTDFTLEFIYNGREFLLTTFPAPDFRLTYNLSGISLMYTTSRGGKVEKGEWSIPLNGTGIT